MMMYKQCKLRKGNTITYRWVNSVKSIEDTMLIFKNVFAGKVESWMIEEVWHLEQAGKRLYYVID